MKELGDAVNKINPEDLQEAMGKRWIDEQAMIKPLYELVHTQIFVVTDVVSSCEISYIDPDMKNFTIGQINQPQQGGQVYSSVFTVLPKDSFIPILTLNFARTTSVVPGDTIEALIPRFETREIFSMDYRLESRKVYTDREEWLSEEMAVQIKRFSGEVCLGTERTSDYGLFIKK